MQFDEDLPVLPLKTLKSSYSIEENEEQWDCNFTYELNWRKDKDCFQWVNEYKLGEELGRGSFGLVRYAERYEEKNGEVNLRPFAVKIMSKRQLCKMAEYVNEEHGSCGMKKVTAEDKVRREIEIMRHLFHRNVVLLFEVIEGQNDQCDEESFICMVMELMKGPSMKYFNDGKFYINGTEGLVYSEMEAKSLFRDLLSGLQYLHDKKICHRDIKPDNLMIYENGTLRIADFGCARKFPPDSNPVLRNTDGTFSFLAPECLNEKGEFYCPFKADIWASGITLYAWIFGVVPFYRTSPEPLYEAIRSDPLEFGSALHDGSIEIFVGVLNRDPEKRFSIERCLRSKWFDGFPSPSYQVTE